MRISYDQITAAIEASLNKRPFEVPAVRLMPIEPPRDWGVSTNICFTLGPQAAKDTIELETEGLSKQEAKKIAQQRAREGGEWLATHLAEELNELLGTDRLPLIARVEAEGAYVNFYYDVPALTAHVVTKAVGQASLPVDPASLPVDLADPSLFGHGETTNKRIMVEYAQPNTHKDFHVGHLRNASIGQAIANLLEFAGNDVLKATYIGDVGAHVAKAMWGIKRLTSGELVNYARTLQSYCEKYKLDIQVPVDDIVNLERISNLAENEISALPLEFWSKLYKSVHSLFELYSSIPDLIDEDDKDDEYLDIVNIRFDIKAKLQQWLFYWETHNTQVRQDWQDSKDGFMSTLNIYFSELQVKFDSDLWFFESTVEDTKLGQKTAAELKQLGIAEIDESEDYKGALYVDFEKHAEKFPEDQRKRIRKLGKMTILRSDGTSLYQTKELGLAKHKFDLVREKYGRELDESLYVVGAEQKLYFEQVFAILKLWGFKNADHCRHIAYELVVLPEGKMSSREGTVVSYRELRDEAVRRAMEITREKGIGAKDAGGAVDEAKVKQIAHDVAIAAIKYAMLEVTGSQQIVFDFERALSFAGRSAPYLQYAYARAGKLVAGADDLGATHASPVTPGSIDTPLHASEVALARVIGRFPTVCREAAANYEPATLCSYLYDLATAFSEFYRDCRVLDAPEPERGFRRDLTRAFRAVMNTGFAILALPLPEEM
ncbi:arginine--tRNA ligase [bacterium]|nr:arginine--tRNA ligase [bacterium]